MMQTGSLSMFKRLCVTMTLLLFVYPFALADGQMNVQMDVPAMFQADYPDVLFTLKGIDRSVASSGCSVVCASMVIKYFNPDEEQTPETLLMEAYEKKLYVGNGMSQKALMELLKAHGVQFKWRHLAKSSLRETLEAGKPIIAYMGKGFFSNSGHYIVLTGISETGMISVIDPNSPEKSEKTYQTALILRQSRGSMPYIVCERAAPE